ncbi:hypothetical protein H072_5951 [Dactylellina haptotyla CBS 200.50]|uniref:GRAM domain-containing protein n=1 Tax=Dactylellina haptotyla (strain CBS 200.50) TaxID=1284197 RepID=S8ABF7_DACHA|nr:hypothetical protein H072_5951 [Dactylellina haptotyla CBS 200.50]
MPFPSHPQSRATSATSSHLLKPVNIKSRPPRSRSQSRTRQLATSPVPKSPSHQILGFDPEPFRLTKDDIELIKSCDKNRFEPNGRVIPETEQRLQELKIAQRKMLVNWVSDRHMKSASVIRAKPEPWPTFEETVETEGYISWVGKVALYFGQKFTPIYTSPWTEIPKYEAAVTASHVERVAAGLAPFREWAMVVRRVYRWEDPVKTARWLTVYAVLWNYGYLVTFGYVYLIARVLRNRQNGEDVELVKEAIHRVKDRGAGVHRAVEQIERHGAEGWIEGMDGEFAGWAQLKVGDLADGLEVLRNFYEWKSPAQTVYALIFSGLCILLGIFTDTEYCWRIITFIFGLLFFVSAPVASRWPRYRWVVSPFKWVFWGIPTHRDLAYSEFQHEAVDAIKDPSQLKKSARRRARRRKVANYEGPAMIIEDDEEEDEGYVTNSPDIDEDEEDDPEELISPVIPHHPDSLKGKPYIGEIYCGFRCIYRETPGKLFISNHGLLLETEIQKKIMTELVWRDIRSIHKKEGLNIGKIGKVHALEVVLIAGDVVVFDALARRDKAFNRIIGFSSLRWQAGL